MRWVRIDNRLVHGQIIETWLPFTRARMIAVVNDELAGDAMRREIMSLAIPDKVEIVFLELETAPEFFRRSDLEGVDILVLFSNCRDAKTAYDNGFAFNSLNIGNLHYGPGKKQICPHVALSEDDVSCLSYFESRGVGLDYRSVPNDPVQSKTL